MDALKLDLLSSESLYLLKNLGCSLKLLPHSDLASAHRLEMQAFPPDEACTIDQMEMRYRKAGELLVGCYKDCIPESLKKEGAEGMGGENGGCNGPNGQDSSSPLLPRKLVGLITSTRISSDELNGASMSSHDSKGTTLCIHSVMVVEKARRRGIASAMLAAYLEHISGFSDLKHARLITKPHLLGFYTKAGFLFIRHSPVLHGRDCWLEMGIELHQNPAPRGLPWFHVDTFTSKAFSGNPVNVFFTHANNNALWMQSCTLEMNTSLSVFVERIVVAGEGPVESTLSSPKRHPRSAELGIEGFDNETVPKLTISPRKQKHMDAHHRNEGNDECEEGGEIWLQSLQQHRFRIRWFTPLMELYLCDHATLAAAHALWERNIVNPNSSRIIFETQKNEDLVCQMGADGWISMLFPAKPADVRLTPYETAEAQEALGLLSSDIISARCNSTQWLVVISLEAFSERLYPDVGLPLMTSCTQFVIVTCAATDSDEVDFYSRMFCPKVGIDEDPVCGSAHCALAPFWAEMLGRASLIGEQKSHRGGVVRCRYIKRRKQVELAGLSVTVATGIFQRPMDFYYTTK